jgi:hypothetical protein
LGVSILSSARRNETAPPIIQQQGKESTKMKVFDEVLALAGGLLMVTAVASAATQNQQSVTRLNEAKRELAAKASGLKGSPRAQLDQERLRVGNLIEDLEAGKQVSPQEIDSVLRRADEAGG